MKGKPSDADAAIGQRVRARRKLLGFTSQQLATLLAVSHQQIHKYENGHNRIPISYLAKMAKILNVNVDFFIETTPVVLAPSFDHKKITSFRAAELVNQPETSNLIKGFISISDPRVRSAVVELVTSITKCLAKRAI